ncbi:GP46-like surface antigen, putative [Bodo saltans]|uniref:GP46-like surface antigen, putative n=1 Tax=Bodo saltans TaxID=75058 RepID=A0A0S4JNX5_BODSA|nr:GP46-like surface antigen, putative [Bodo saltans]|eukprot:CUG90972.1 GP46-like surface antigen, putative [Bodo saltans]
MSTVSNLTHTFVARTTHLAHLIVLLAMVSALLHAQELDRAALVAFYSGTNGPTSWNSSIRWDTANSSSNSCNWYGVTCGSGGRVTKIVLRNAGLSGTLPPLLGTIKKLNNIDLQSNRLSGIVPKELANCTNLIELHLQVNRLSGTFPPEFSSLSQLSIFHMSNNSLYGTLPSSYQSLTQLTSFEVDQNELTGTLPPEYSAWNSIQSFYADRNGFTGSLPPEYSAWKSIVTFRTFINPLTGTLPESYGSSWTNAVSVFIYTTNISGSIPGEWGGMTSLYQLQIFNNKLTGTIPASFGNFTKLYYINLSFNNLTGEVPWAAWSKLRGVDVFGFQDNPLLSGTIPIGFSDVLVPFLSMVSVCRTRICGPRLPALTLGYGCVPPSFVSSLGEITTAAMSSMVQIATYEPSFSCETPQPTLTPRARDVTRTVLVVPPPAPHSDHAASLATSGPTVTASLVVVSQLISGAAASAGGLHAMQALMRIQRLRDLCVAQNQLSSSLSTSSSGDDDDGSSSDCCDELTSPLHLTIDVNGNSVGEKEAGALIGNTIALVVFGLLRIVGQWTVHRFKQQHSTANFEKREASTIFHHVTTALIACFSSKNISTIWPAYTFLICPTVGVCCMLLQVGNSDGLFVAVALLALWTIPCIAANVGLAYNEHLQKAARSFSLCSVETHETKLRSSVLTAAWQRMKDFLLQPTEELEFSNHVIAKAIEHAYGAVLFGFRSSRLWYFNVELFFGIATGVLIGVTLSSSDPCSINTVGWIMAAVGLLECVSAFCIRPYCAPVDFVVLAVVNGLSVVSQMIALMDDSSSAQVASVVLGLVASGFQLVVSVLLAIDGCSGSSVYHAASVTKHDATTMVATSKERARRRSRSCSRSSDATRNCTTENSNASEFQHGALVILIRTICNSAGDAASSSIFKW